MTLLAVADFTSVPSLDALHTALRTMHICPGWAKPEPSLWPRPQQHFLPAIWHWETCRTALAIAGKLVSTELAERRNLILYNPLPGNGYATTTTMVAAYQMLLPGEKARSHRHTPNALRLILEGEGAYSVVDGERLDMRPGDVVLTPNWYWHGHGNDGEMPCYWFDGLDVPLVHTLGPMFFEPYPTGFQEPEVCSTDSPSDISLGKDAGSPRSDHARSRRFLRRARATRETGADDHGVVHATLTCRDRNETVPNHGQFHLLCARRLRHYDYRWGNLALAAWRCGGGASVAAPDPSCDNGRHPLLDDR